MLHYEHRPDHIKHSEGLYCSVNESEDSLSRVSSGVIWCVIEFVVLNHVIIPR
jgi:hypothetical protein